MGWRSALAGSLAPEVREFRCSARGRRDWMRFPKLSVSAVAVWSWPNALSLERDHRYGCKNCALSRVAR
jgi:hypothetical protein